MYRDRILRGTGSGGNHSTLKLGAIGADLGAVACFFERPWGRLSPSLSAPDQAWLLNEAAYRLRALGRLTEAAEPMRATLEMYIEQEEWKFAAIAAGNLSELELTLGEVSAAIADPAQSVTFADDSGDWGQQMSKRTTHADALHQAGRRDEARQLFAEAEALQAERQPSYPRLYSVQGFRYCDLLLSDAERAAWRQVVAALRDAASSDGSPEEPRRGASGPLSDCDAVTERAAQTLEWMTSDPHAPILTIAVDHLTLSRAELYRALCSQSKSANQKSKIHAPLTAAVDGLREAGAMNHLPKSLLTRAWHRQLTGNAAGAASDLNEAWEIAERGPMPLYQADILLTRARLFGTTKFLSEVEGRNAERGTGKEDGYPWGSRKRISRRPGA